MIAFDINTTREGFVTVWLDKTAIGAIRQEPKGWRYWPKGKTKLIWAGELFPTLAECKADVKGDE